MDCLEKTQVLLKWTVIPKERIAADCGVSIGTVFLMTKPDANPKYRNLKKVYEYLSGRKMEA